MSETVTAVYDGKVFRLDTPLNLKTNNRYLITIQELPQENAWDILEALTGTIEAPEDWAVEHDHYLYGPPKQAIKPSHE